MTYSFNIRTIGFCITFQNIFSFQLVRNRDFLSYDDNEDDNDNNDYEEHNHNLGCCHNDNNNDNHLNLIGFGISDTICPPLEMLRSNKKFICKI